ncbi:MAG TPA: PSD1 and planctomycete cytochrome C domain-containing protein, partial [Gemmataceae bacterium]|nr:PSD1 and planctomycete cytochrome C domain-containing protein [Gemmataceae bacterium]
MRLTPRAWLCLAALACPAPLVAADGPPVDYQRDVLPILQARCYKCHDAARKKSGYRIDSRSSALRGGESGKPAIVPGDGSKSELIRRITTATGDEAMPAGKDKLTPEQVRVLRAWVDAGAAWPDALANEQPVHWAFRAPRRPALPPISNLKSQIRNPIDRFVLARLEKEGLAPSPEADRVTLIRRLSLDLTGLPPTVKEVDDFVADKSDRAYEKVVERLLASPHYGERWGRLWLDAARYADSDGFEKDKPRFVWAYRDWVINSYNRDLPYDQFIVQQIAGDLLPNATQDQKAATGYLRNSMINEEGGIDPEQFRMEAMYDRMDAIGKGVLGLTIQCGQCHNHKFDPLTQTEYYRLFAFLNTCDEGSVAVYTPDEQMRRAELFRKIHEIEADLKHREPKWPELMAAWERQVRHDQPAWRVVRPHTDGTGDEKYLPQDDGSVRAAGYAPTKHSPEFTGPTDLTTITAARLEVLNDPNLPLGGPGRSIKGQFALTEFRVFVAPADNPGARKEVKIIRATADVNPPVKELESIYDDRSKRRRVTGPVEYAIDGKDETAWGIDVGPGRSNVPRKAVFVFEEPVSVPKGAVVTFRVTMNHGGWNSDDNQNNNLGRYRFSVTDEPNPVADPLPANVRALLSVPPEKRTAAQVDTIFGYWRTTMSEWKGANAKIEALWRQHPAGASQLVLHAQQKPRETHVLKRGDFLKPGAVVTPGVPAFLHPLKAQGLQSLGPTRLDFARWLADRDSPTTARVLVNRAWQAYFGTGIVSTPEDFGTQGDPPSHPELLDWLAVEFMDRGWSRKELHRLIVTSATYRQSSRVTPQLLERDPQNRLLARGPRFRGDAEVVRDVALAASGLLDEKVGGPSVFPPLPAFMLLPPVSYGPKTWPESHGSDRYRRALYTFRYRSLPYPALQAFDAPNGDFACVRRSRSNTPLQALTGLNEPIFMECARALGAKALAEGGATDADRLTYAFRRCVARRPSAEESAELLGLLTKEKGRFTRPGAKLPAGVTGADAAAWAVVSRVLL